MTANQQDFTGDDVRRLLAEHEGTGITVAAFAREKGIAAYRLYDMRRRLRLRSQEPQPPCRPTFAKVVVKDRPAKPAPTLDLILPGGYQLRLTPDFDEVTLRRLLGVLGSC